MDVRKKFRSERYAEKEIIEEAQVWWDENSWTYSRKISSEGLNGKTLFCDII